MSILDIRKAKSIYFFLSIFCFAFSFIYEIFSHGVYSFYMIAPGFILFLLGYILIPILKNIFNSLAFTFYNFFLACFLTGFYVKGILDIYGTTNSLIYVYFIAAACFLFLTILSLLFKSFKKHE